MQENFDFETYDKIVRENKEEAKEQMEAAFKTYLQKQSAYLQACETEEVWFLIREKEYGGKQNGTIEAN